MDYLLSKATQNVSWIAIGENTTDDNPGQYLTDCKLEAPEHQLPRPIGRRGVG